ncbi:site-specific integrase [Streptomyces lavendulae]|uniref:site-specific integrase n=1 Tax=Streptomyces lavendulae TaxID=1914 RepID=UPI0033F2B3D9
MRRGKPMGRHFLYKDALEIACRKAGLVDGDGNPTVTAHRFRHTVGAQLAEGGAQIQTIRAILGHRKRADVGHLLPHQRPHLGRAVREVIAAGGRIAGPAAEERGYRPSPASPLTAAAWHPPRSRKSVSRGGDAGCGGPQARRLGGPAARSGAEKAAGPVGTTTARPSP